MLPLLILVIIDLMILMRTGATPVEAPGDGGMWTVFGSMGCGWTRKQLDHMKKAGKPHKFVDCDKEDCKKVEAFPTLIAPNGEEHVGFKEV
jgi:hypothetical protein